MDDGYEDLITDDDEEEPLSERRWWSPGSLLTTGASAITAFTISVAATMGFVGYPVAEAVVGFPSGPGEMRERAIVNGIVVLLLIVAVFWLGQRVLLDDEDGPGWGRHLTGSAVVIGAVGTVLATVTIVASLLHSDDFAPMVP